MRYDTTLKEILQAPPRRLLELLAGAPISELLVVEYPAVRVRRPDLVARLTNGRLYHLEIQSANDAEMPWRMLEYYTLIRRQYGQPPLQHVLYVGDRPMAMASGIDEETLKYSYRIVDIREIDGTPLLESDALEDNLLAILCQMDNPQAVIRRLLERIAQLPIKKRADALARLLVLSGLRRLHNLIGEEVKRMPATMDIMDNPFLRELFESGEKKLLRQQLERRFGALPEWALEKLKEAEMDTVERWGLQLLESDSLEATLN